MRPRLLFHDFHQCFYDIGIPLAAVDFVLEDLECGINCHTLTIGSVGGHCVECIGNRSTRISVGDGGVCAQSPPYRVKSSNVFGSRDVG